MYSMTTMQSPRKLNDTNFLAFVNAYQTGLAMAIDSHPQEYGWNSESNPLAVQEWTERTFCKMAKAIESGSYNHDGRGFKNACKIVGIKHTRTAIEAFITAAN